MVIKFKRLKNLGISILLNVVFCTFLISPFSLVAQKPDFSGNWKIDKAKCNFGTTFPEYTAPLEMKVVQESDSISIARLSMNGQGNYNEYVEKLPFDGSVVESMIKSTKKRASIKWSEREEIFIETAAYKDYTFKKMYKAEETWRLSDDKNTLTILRDDEGDDGKDSRKYVFVKQ